MTTMRERINSGKLFSDNCEGLPEDRENAKRKMIALNATGPDDLETRFRLIKEIFGGKADVSIDEEDMRCVRPGPELVQQGVAGPADHGVVPQKGQCYRHAQDACAGNNGFHVFLRDQTAKAWRGDEYLFDRLGCL